MEKQNNLEGRNTHKAEKEYDGISEKYVEATENDPAKRFVQYPEALRLVGELAGKNVLDMGCGNGMFTRMMARAGADVVAYDISESQVKNAKKIEDQEKLGIKYFVADRPAISPEVKFDLVSAIMLLPCAVNQNQLEEMFKDAGVLLKADGKFVCLTLNPDFKGLGEKIYNRRFSKREDGKIGIDFFNENGEVRLSIVDTNFSKEDVEQAALKAGFGEVKWEKLHVDPKGLNQQGKEFWDKFEEDCPYIGVVAQK